MFMTRTEITCAACGGHLGHVFKGERFNTPSMSVCFHYSFAATNEQATTADERHCVNSISLNFDAEDQAKA